MAANPMSRVVEQVRQVACQPASDTRTDGQLLESFVRQRDTVAIEALIQRHAGMVWSVCRRLLADHHDAEDAFQATFLVLVRRAAAIVPRHMVANWLYGVARRTALKARAATAKRRAHEKQVIPMLEPIAPQRADQSPHLQAMLDDELSRLPDIYRSAIVLCELEGHTCHEAARQLGVPDGTLAARLSRGRRCWPAPGRARCRGVGGGAVGRPRTASGGGPQPGARGDAEGRDAAGGRAGGECRANPDQGRRLERRRGQRPVAGQAENAHRHCDRTRPRECRRRRHASAAADSDRRLRGTGPVAAAGSGRQGADHHAAAGPRGGGETSEPGAA